MRFFNPIAMRFAKRATRDDIDDVLAAHANAARLAVEAGFDAVEIHLGHNYLASSFLSPLINRRADEFGGSLENRAKVARGLVRAVRGALDKDGISHVAVTAKLNMADGVRGGISTEESLRTAKWLEEDGGLDAIELTAGSSLVNPMYLFRGDAPVKEFAAAFKPPMRWGVRMMGKKFLREYPYRDAYLLRDARLFRSELSMPLILLDGITNRETMDLAMAEGFEFVAMARALLAEPDLINRIAAEGNRCIRLARTATSACRPSTAAPAVWSPGRRTEPMTRSVSGAGKEIGAARPTRRSTAHRHRQCPHSHLPRGFPADCRHWRRRCRR